jgi:hypothetical protein
MTFLFWCSHSHLGIPVLVNGIARALCQDCLRKVVTTKDGTRVIGEEK